MTWIGTPYCPPRCSSLRELAPDCRVCRVRNTAMFGGACRRILIEAVKYHADLPLNFHPTAIRASTVVVIVVADQGG